MDVNITTNIYNHHSTSSFFQTFILLFGIIPYTLLTHPITLIITSLAAISTRSFSPLNYYIIPYTLALITSLPIKYLTHRTRPGCNPKFPKLKLKMDPIASPLCATDERFLSFPSGHTTLITALLTPLILYTHEKVTSKIHRYIIYTILYLIILATALQRMSFGYHFFTDTIAGFLLGSLCGYISYKYLINK